MGELYVNTAGTVMMDVYSGVEIITILFISGSPGGGDGTVIAGMEWSGDCDGGDVDKVMGMWWGWV